MAEEDLLIVTDEELLDLGLQLVGYSDDKIDRAQIETNEARFRSLFGSSSFACAQLWETLQVTETEAARVEGTLFEREQHLKRFLMALYWLKSYPTETQREALFGSDPKTSRKWAWYIVEKIAALEEEKVSHQCVSSPVFSFSNNSPRSKIFIPPEWYDDPTPEFIMSVDGTHCRIFEPKHPTMSKNPKYYSHKFHQAGLNYEIGVSLFESRVVWVNGPFPAGQNDMKIFREQGLMAAIPPGKLLTGDNGYRGLPYLISTPNPRDPEELRVFKRRARA
jgi:DDE superfamily endonuclease